MQSQLDDDSTTLRSEDLRSQFQKKLQQLLESHSHLNHSDRRRTNVALKDGGGSGDVYEAYLWIGENRVKVALKQIRSYMLKDKNFAKV